MEDRIMVMRCKECENCRVHCVCLDYMSTWDERATPVPLQDDLCEGPEGLGMVTDPCDVTTVGE